MRIKRPNKYRQGESPERLERYLANDLQNTLTDITTALTKLTFQDNFKAQVVSATIAPGATDTAIRHKLGTVPYGRIIVRGASNDIIDGATAWTAENIYLRCTGAFPQLITIIILG